MRVPAKGKSIQSTATIRLTLSRFRWKLTFSYTIVTVLSLLVTFLLLTVLMLWFFSTFLSNSRLLASQLQQQAPTAAIFFDHGKVDDRGISRWLHAVYLDTFRPYHGFIAVVDLHERLVAVDGTEVSIQTTFASKLGPQAYARLEQLLKTRPSTNTPILLDGPGSTTIIMPIGQADDHTLEGALVWKITQNPLATSRAIYFPLVIGIVMVALVFCLLFTLIGTFFGFFTARGFTRRLARLSTVVAHWSQGDFQHAIVDPSRDELGQVAQQLNRMAQQLQNVLQTQQKFAVLEERNRLARDLHDSVKQQVFSASMQLSTADSVIEQNAPGAQKHIHAAEALIGQVQEELGSIIHALRPVGLENRDLAGAVTSYIRDWESQTGIQASIVIDPLPVLSSALETACYRVVQEALSNVARHSGARAITVRLQHIHDLLTLSIHDNGRGFQVTRKLGTGVGLQSMCERVEELHGSVDITSDKQHGTTINVTYPLDQQES